MKRFIATVVFKKKLNVKNERDLYEEMTLFIEAESLETAEEKLEKYIEKYSSYTYKGGRDNIVEVERTEFVKLDEVLGFEKEDGVEELNSYSFVDIESYKKYKCGKID